MAGGLQPGQRVHQHGEEGHDHDDRGLGLPVEAEPDHHDRRDADDRQRRDEIADRQEAALDRNVQRSARTATTKPEAAADDEAGQHRLQDGLVEIGPQDRAAMSRCARRWPRAAAAARTACPRRASTASQMISTQRPNSTGTTSCTAKPVAGARGIAAGQYDRPAARPAANSPRAARRSRARRCLRPRIDHAQQHEGRAHGRQSHAAIAASPSAGHDQRGRQMRMSVSAKDMAASTARLAARRERQAGQRQHDGGTRRRSPASSA